MLLQMHWQVLSEYLQFLPCSLVAAEKALYQAPEGITEDMMEPAIEIEIEDPESVTIGMGGLEIEISHDEENDKFNENLAEKMEEDEMVGLATDLIGDYDDDISSRKDWVQTYVDGLELLGLKIEERTAVAWGLWCVSPAAD